MPESGLTFQSTCCAFILNVCNLSKLKVSYPPMYDNDSCLVLGVDYSAFLSDTKAIVNKKMLLAY